MRDLNVARFGTFDQAQDDRVPTNCLDFASVHRSPVRVTAGLVGCGAVLLRQDRLFPVVSDIRVDIGGERRG